MQALTVIIGRDGYWLATWPGVLLLKKEGKEKK